MDSRSKEFEKNASAEQQGIDAADEELLKTNVIVETSPVSKTVEENVGGESSRDVELLFEEEYNRNVSHKRNIDTHGDVNESEAGNTSSGGEVVREEGSLLRRRFSELDKKRREYTKHLEFIDSNPSKLSYLQLTFNEFLAQTEALESEFKEGENQETIFQDYLDSTGPKKERELLWLLRANRFELVQQSKRQWRESRGSDKSNAEEEGEHNQATTSAKQGFPTETSRKEK